MLVSLLLLGWLAVAAYTDIRWRKVYNWNTYSGMLVAVALAAVATLSSLDVVRGGQRERYYLGIAPVDDCLLGLVACGGVMVVCFVFFAGGVGGGDVKLLAMIGAWQGVYPGIETLLWTFVLGGAGAMLILIWRHGAVSLARRFLRFALWSVRLAGQMRLSDEDRKPLQTDLFLSPSALAATVLVRFQLLDRLAAHWA